MKIDPAAKPFTAMAAAPTLLAAMARRPRVTLALGLLTAGVTLFFRDPDRTPDRSPVTDADVVVEFYMPAMPAMKMAEMRNSVPLKHEGGGRYRGTGNVMMAGGWDTTVRATRGGQEIGSKTFTVTAK